MKVKILCLAPDLPFPVIGGGRMRMKSIIEAIAEYAEIDIACIADTIPNETHKWIASIHGSISNYRRVRLQGLWLWIHRMVMLFAGSNLFYDSKEQDYFNKCFNAAKPDIVWLETPYLFRYALEWNRSIPVVVDYWGTSQGAERDYRNACWTGKLWEFFRWRSALGSERRYAHRLKNIVTVSKLDAEYFRSIAPDSRIWSVPIGLQDSLDHTDQEDACNENGNLMLMTGDLSYRPNIDAVCYFADKIWPMIISRVPQAEVKFTGKSPAPEILKLNSISGVTVQGFVPDLGSVIRESAVYILPMRLGSGIRSKLFDVFPLCKPIVTTSIGAEGIDFVDGENCMIKDDPSDFADACVCLLKNTDERIRLGMAVKDLAENIYSRENIESLVREVILTILNKKGL